MTPEEFNKQLKLGKEFNEQIDQFHADWRNWLHNNPLLRDLSISIGIHGFINLCQVMQEVDGDDGQGATIAMAMFATYTLQRCSIGGKQINPMFSFGIEKKPLSYDMPAPELFSAILQQMLETKKETE